MLEYSALIEGREEDGLRATFSRRDDGEVTVDLTRDKKYINMSGEQFSLFLAEYDKFLQACKCVEVV